MGLVIVFISARFAGYDALPDPVGWGLAIAGLVPLRSRIPHGGTLLFLGVIAGVMSVPLVLPSVNDRLTASGQWGVGVPQTVFCLTLVLSLIRLADRAGDPEVGRLGLLRTAYLAVLVLPAIVYGGGVVALAVPAAALSVVTNVALVYYTFKVSRRYGLDPEAVTDPGAEPDADAEPR